MLYTFDKANRLTSVTDWSNRTTQYTYNGMRVATVVFPSGIVETRGYDVGRPADRRNFHAGRLDGGRLHLDA